MTEKVILDSDKSCTVTASGETTKVRFEGSYRYIQVRHMSGEIICGRKPGIADGEDGTSKLTSGGICFDVASPVIYIGGNGVCEVYATNSEMLVFKDAPASGGGGNTIINDNIFSTDTTLSSQKILDVIDWRRGITMYEIATLTGGINSGTHPQSITIDLPVDTIICAEIYDPAASNYDKGYQKLADVWLRIFDVADGKNSRTNQAYGTSSATVTLRYTPSTQLLYITTSASSTAYVAKIYRVEGVTWGFEVHGSTDAKG